MVFGKISSVFKGFASKVLAIDNTSAPTEQILALRQMFPKSKFDFSTEDFTELLSVMKRKHLVDSIIITKKDGTIVASSEKNGLKAAITGTALFNYVSSELSKTETVLIKSDGEWFMVFSFNNRVFVVKAQANLSTIELRALAKEIDTRLKKCAKEADNKAF